MKKIQSKHVKIAVTVVISAAILYVVMNIIDNIGLVYGSLSAAVSFIMHLLRPVLIGFIIAFLLHRPAEFFAGRLRRTRFFAQRRRGAQVLGVFIVFVLLLAALAAFLYVMVPSVIQSFVSITADIPQFTRFIDRILSDISQDTSVKQIFDFIGIDVTSTNSINEIVTEFWTEITGFLQTVTAWLLGFIVNTGVFVYNFVLGLFFAIYMMMYKDQVKGQIMRLSRSVFGRQYYRLAFTYRVADGMFNKFLVGKGILSIGVGAVVFILCTIFGFRYSVLISLIITVTNMVPTFGPFIGAIPATLLAMMTEPIFGLYMIIIIVVVQIVEGNIVGPRVLGESMGINGFWIIFSIIIMGGLFGVVGMVIAAPLFGLLRILIKNWLVRKETNGEKLVSAEQYAVSLQRYQAWIAKRPKKQRQKN